MERRKGIDDDSQLDSKSLGERLRQRRKEMNLTLKEAENATSIRKNYLEAIEDGNLNKLLSTVYSQGFFKQYAAFLGMDGEQIIRENPSLFSYSESQEFSYGIGTLEARSHPGSYVKWFPNLIWILGFGLVLVFAWYVARFLGVV